MSVRVFPEICVSLSEPRNEDPHSIERAPSKLLRAWIEQKLQDKLVSLFGARTLFSSLETDLQALWP
jgi:hypothetical protein